MVIDDAAVTPKYVHGFEADRELPIIWRIALGSLKNKLIILLPRPLALTDFLPQAITPLLMLGGAYLCFEGAEKVFHALFPHADHAVEEDFDTKDPAHLEEEKVAGAIKTDFILSAEIMTIALAAIPDSPASGCEAVTLAVVGIAITVGVYGAVALIVKMDDIGLFMARRGRAGADARLRARAGAGDAEADGVSVTSARRRCCGSAAPSCIHGLEVLGFGWLGHHIHDWAAAAGHAAAAGAGLCRMGGDGGDGRGFRVWRWACADPAGDAGDRAALGGADQRQEHRPRTDGAARMSFERNLARILRRNPCCRLRAAP